MARYAFAIVLLLRSLPAGKATSNGKWLSLSPSMEWDGIDGMWSTFQVEIGDPEQVIRLLPGTSAFSGNVISIVTSQGCDQIPAIANCTSSRGNVFSSNMSSTWSTKHLTDGAKQDPDDNMASLVDVPKNVSYGFDTLRFPCPDVPLVANLMIAEYSTDSSWLGTLALSPLAFNLSNSDISSPSLLSVLRHRGGIDSLSWAYTAGAYYRSVFGSLTLGGYDESRFDAEKSITVPFATDPSRDLVVGIQSITYNTSGSTPASGSAPLGGGFYAFIDSMVAQMGLPVSVCEQFEQAFNLTWNATSQLYLVEDRIHAALVKLDPIIIFTIGGADALAGGRTVNISLPYSAFDLNISAPLVQETSRYFPLKRANSSSEYTLGRVFLQAAYLFADYDRSEFRVSQALYPEYHNRKELVAVDPRGEQHLSASEIAGVAIAAVVLIGIIITVGVIVRLRTRRTSDKHGHEHEGAMMSDKEHALPDSLSESSASVKSAAELSGFETQVHEANSGDRYGKRASVRYELPVDMAVAELDGSCHSK